MPKDTKTLGNNKARAWESLGFVHKKGLCLSFDTTSYDFIAMLILFRRMSLMSQNAAPAVFCCFIMM